MTFTHCPRCEGLLTKKEQERFNWYGVPNAKGEPVMKNAHIGTERLMTCGACFHRNKAQLVERFKSDIARHKLAHR